MKAKKHIENKNFIDLLPIAMSLGIDFSKHINEFEKSMKDRIRQIQLQIYEMQKTIYWQWEDYSDDQKIQAIDLILKRSGIERSKEEIKKAVNKKIKRKIGTRPQSLKEIRNLK